MTATEELRRMLDERGVEHFDGIIMTYTDDADYMPSASNTFDVTLYNLTPAQAIDAALGRGTCHIAVQDNLAETDGMGDVWLECDACHWQMPLEPSTPRFRYCPNCGRKVVDE